MTENNNVNLLPYSTEKLLVNFTKSRFSLYLFVAVVIHVIFITLTSIGYINDRWIDPEGAARRKSELQAAQSNQMAAAAASAAPAVTGIVAATAGSNAPAPAPRTNTAIIKQITDTAKPSKIPKAPDDLGISIKDTNPQ